MRTIFLFISLVICLFGAEVDKRFFDKASKEAFFSSMEHNISQTQDKALSLLESTLLSKIKERDKKKIDISFEKETIDQNASLSLLEFGEKLDTLISAKIDYSDNEEKMAQVALKRDYIVDQIEHIVEENKNLLLSYQLQYTLYRQVLEYEQQKKQMLDSVIAHNESMLQSVLPRLKTDDYTQTVKSLDDIQSQITVSESKKAALTAELERSQLIEAKETGKIDAQKEALESKLELLYKDAAKEAMRQSLLALALKKNEVFYISQQKTVHYINHIGDDRTPYQYRYEQLKVFGKNTFGTASMAVIASKESFSETVRFVGSLLSRPLFIFNEKAVTSGGILKVLFILIAGMSVASFYRRRIQKWSEGWIRATPMTVKLIANFGYYVIVLITFLVAINSIGIDLTSLSMLASALAIGVGFGLQTVVSNMVSGIIMMFERSIRVGDYIEISDTLRGTVTDMRIRSTVIKTQDNIDIVVPNSSFIQNNVINLTLDDKMRRRHIPFGVAYGTEVEKVEDVILTALQQSDLNYYKGFDETKKPQIWMTGMGASSVDYELLVWIEWGSKDKKAATKSDFLILIYKTLNQHNIQIPFPQMDLHLKTVEKIDLGDV